MQRPDWCVLRNKLLRYRQTLKDCSRYVQAVLIKISHLNLVRAFTLCKNSQIVLNDSVHSGIRKKNSKHFLSLVGKLCLGQYQFFTQFTVYFVELKDNQVQIMSLQALKFIILFCSDLPKNLIVKMLSANARWRHSQNHPFWEKILNFSIFNS